MKKPEWPGIATAVGILFALTIVIAVAGDPEFKLKDWQTLMAACVALIGGTLAYFGATAKVEFDRETARRDSARKRTGVYLRLEATLAAIDQHCQAILDALKELESGKTDWIEPDPIPDVLSSSLQDAWDNLDLFPRALARELFWIRGALMSFHATVARFPDGKLVMDAQEESLRKRLAVVPRDLEDISKSCKIVMEWLSLVIETGADTIRSPS